MKVQNTLTLKTSAHYLLSSFSGFVLLGIWMSTKKWIRRWKTVLRWISYLQYSVR